MKGSDTKAGLVEVQVACNVREVKSAWSFRPTMALQCRAEWFACQGHKTEWENGFGIVTHVSFRYYSTLDPVQRREQ
jgi:hypothetical protein